MSIPARQGRDGRLHTSWMSLLVMRAFMRPIRSPGEPDGPTMDDAHDGFLDSEHLVHTITCKWTMLFFLNGFKTYINTLCMAVVNHIISTSIQKLTSPHTPVRGSMLFRQRLASPRSFGQPPEAFWGTWHPSSGCRAGSRSSPRRGVSVLGVEGAAADRALRRKGSSV